MFERLFKGPRALTRQRNGPLAEERLRYLVHCAEQQMSPGTLRRIAISTLVVAKALRLADRPGELVTRAEIEAEADRRANRRPRPPVTRETHHPRLRFVGYATRWLTFLGRLQLPTAAPRPYAEHVAQFSGYMLRQRGLSPLTASYRCRDVHELLARLDEAGLRLDALTVAPVDELLARKIRDGVMLAPPSRPMLRPSGPSSGMPKAVAGVVPAWRRRSCPRGPSRTRPSRRDCPGTK